MANIKSQIKRNKQNEKARQRNKAVKSSLKTSVRKFREAADAGDVEAATVAHADACRNLDKAASKGVIHKNQAANRKSAIAHRAAELSSPDPVTRTAARLSRAASRVAVRMQAAAAQRWPLASGRGRPRSRGWPPPARSPGSCLLP